MATGFQRRPIAQQLIMATVAALVLFLSDDSDRSAQGG